MGRLIIDFKNLKIEEVKELLSTNEISYIGEDGLEYPNSKSMFVDVNPRVGPSMEERLKRILRNERIKDAISKAGYETYDDALDFDTGEMEPLSPYEFSDMEDENPLPLEVDSPPPPQKPLKAEPESDIVDNGLDDKTNT